MSIHQTGSVVTLSMIDAFRAVAVVQCFVLLSNSKTDLRSNL